MKIDLRIIVFFFLIGFLNDAHSEVRLLEGCPPLVVYGQGPCTDQALVFGEFCDPNINIAAMHHYATGIDWEHVGELLGQNVGEKRLGLTIICQGLDPSTAMPTAIISKASNLPCIGFKNTINIEVLLYKDGFIEVGLGCRDSVTDKFKRFQAYKVTPEGCISRMKLREFSEAVLRPGKELRIVGSHREAVFCKTPEGDVFYAGSWSRDGSKFTDSPFEGTDYSVKAATPRARGTSCSPRGGCGSSILSRIGKAQAGVDIACGVVTTPQPTENGGHGAVEGALVGGVILSRCLGVAGGLILAAPAFVGDYFAREYIDIYKMQASELDRCTDLAVYWGQRRREGCMHYTSTKEDRNQCLAHAKRITDDEFYAFLNPNQTAAEKLAYPPCKTAYN